MNEWLKAAAPATGGVAAAIVSALCCAGPVLAVAVGASSAGFASTFEPLRPYFLVATGGFLILGFWLLHREEQKACEPGKACADPRVRRTMRITLWTATVLAAVFATFPSWQDLVL
ncbi:MAG: mercuric transporter MerT family protein [Candidatus Longimicrobiales bacterium M2_2A_002]